MEFDRKFSRMFSRRPAKDIANDAGIFIIEFKKTFETGNVFTSGMSVEYAKSMLVCTNNAGEDTSSTVLRPGVRFPSF